MPVERTFSILKPDATERNLTGAINAMIEKAGLRIVAQKRVRITRAQAEKFYAVHKERPFFRELVDFMISGPVVVQVLEGEGAIAKYRDVMGATDPAKAAAGTIRKVHAKSIGENSVHGSDAPDTATARDRAIFLGKRNRRLADEQLAAAMAAKAPKPPSRRRGWETLAVQAIATEMAQPAFWLSVLQVIWINILLSGDNAVVIALACRGLPPRQRLWGMVIGAGFASVLLIVFTGVVALLMTLPYLKLVGALLLFWIAAKLLVPDEEDSGDETEAVEDLWRAIRIVVIADLVMSLDNVIAVAAVAKGQYVLLTLGLAVSIPMVIAGSAIILALLERFPVLVWGGAAILGWVAGDIFASDPIVLGAFSGYSPDHVELAAQVLGAALVLAAGYVWRRYKLPAESEV